MKSLFSNLSVTMASANYTLDLSMDEGASDDNDEVEECLEQWQQPWQESQGPDDNEVIFLPLEQTDYASSLNTTFGQQRWSLLTTRSFATVEQKKEMLKKINSDFLCNVTSSTAQTTIQSMIDTPLKNRDSASHYAQRILTVIAILQFEKLCNTGPHKQFSPDAISFLELSTRLDMSIRENEQVGIKKAEQARKPKITV